MCRWCGLILIGICVYTLLTGDVEPDYRSAKIINTQTGECRYLTNNDYEGVLSGRELGVLRLINQGFMSKEIAEMLSISINTVNRHRQNIISKLKVDSAIEACSLARKMGLID